MCIEIRLKKIKYNRGWIRKEWLFLFQKKMCTKLGEQKSELNNLKIKA